MWVEAFAKGTWNFHRNFGRPAAKKSIRNHFLKHCMIPSGSEFLGSPVSKILCSEAHMPSSGKMLLKVQTAGLTTTLLLKLHGSP